MRYYIPNPFNPGLFTPEQLNALFTVRQKKFDRIVKELAAAAYSATPQTHFLIVGERGMGKTTLLLRIFNEINATPSLSAHLTPIIFSEEQLGITKLYKLWESVADLLDKEGGLFEGLTLRIDALYKGGISNADYERAAFRAIFDIFEKADRKLILFIDNFGDMIARFDDQERQQLREVLMLYPRLQVVAASPVVSEDFYIYQHPLFESFKRIQLESLSLEETKLLLLRLGEVSGTRSIIEQIIARQPYRIDALHRLTGGNTRIVVILFNMLVNNQNSGIFNEFVSLTDLLTGFYTQKINDIKGQRGEIIDTLALNFDAMGSGEIARKVKMESNVVSTLIKSLVADEIVEEIKPDHTKNKLYRLRDRFFNIWYLMRYAANRAGKNRVRWLVMFFEEWLTHYERNKRGEEFVRDFWRESYDPTTKALVGEAMMQVEGQSEYVIKLITEALTTDEAGNPLQTHAPEAEQTGTTLRSHADVDKMRLINFNLQIDLNHFRDLLKAAPLGLKAKSDIINTFPALNQERAELLLVFLTEKQRDLEEFSAQLYGHKYRQSNEKVALKLCVAEALLSDGDVELALANLKEITEYDCDQPNSKLLTANLFAQIGDKALEQKRYFQAERAYLAGSQFGDARSAFMLGQIYEIEIKKYDKAVKAYQLAIQMGYTDLFSAFFRKAWSLRKNNQLKQAIEAYEQALEMALTQEQQLGTLHNLGHIYGFTSEKNFEKARYFRQKAYELDPSDEQANGLAWLYFYEGKYKDSAIKLAKLLTLSNDPNHLHSAATILLWDDQVAASQSIADKFLYNTDFLEKSIEEDPFDLYQYFMLLCAKKQYDFLLNYFNGEKGLAISTKDRFRPIYFALTHLLKNQFPTEYLKMPPELDKIVEEILAKIDKMAIMYNQNENE